jgi:putative transposase
VAATETALAELMSRRLDDLDLVALMIDGMHFGEHTCVVALGVGIDGVKYPLALEEGSTENATLVTDLITGLRERGLDVTRPILAVLDGAKALSRAVRDVFDQPLIQRCQQHKVKNVRDKLPERLRTVEERRMRQAYHAESAVQAEGLLTELARELDKTRPLPVGEQAVLGGRRASGSARPAWRTPTCRAHRAGAAAARPIGGSPGCHWRAAGVPGHRAGGSRR